MFCSMSDESSPRGDIPQKTLKARSHLAVVKFKPISEDFSPIMPFIARRVQADFVAFPPLPRGDKENPGPINYRVSEGG